ncbi:MAG TPA: ABC transporter substrate-binding protein [Candidatus Limnocylindrales bacterium]
MHAALRRGRLAGSPVDRMLIPIALSLTLALAGCVGGTTPAATAGSAASATPAPAWPLTLTDDEGNVVELKTEPRRIVSLTPATTEIAFALGAGARVVATTDFDDYPPEVRSLPHVATFSSVDVEKIIGLDADLVLAGGNSFNSPEALDRLRTLGMPVLAVYAPTVGAVLSDIELVGRAIGRADEAKALVGSMRGQIDSVSAATADLPHPRTFYELDATKDIFGPADDSFVAEMVRLAGGTPITTGSTTVFSIPLEKLVAADPEVIVLGDANYGATPEIVAGRPGWGGIAAVRSAAIRPVDDVVVTRPGPRLPAGLRSLALAIHPDLSLPPVPS